jgi:FAD/FMN-containing dehydrogenase
MSGFGRLGPELGRLKRRVDGRLLEVEHPLAACVGDLTSPVCARALDDLRNPFVIEDHPGAFQTTGWAGAFTSEPSPHAVVAAEVEDIVAAVEFANEHRVRLVVKGTGHDYLGRSSARDSLLVWTHGMREVTVHDSFSISGAARPVVGVPAITVGAGTRWLEVYQAAIERGRFVLGGGCTSVGAGGGFTLGGGFGSFSRRFGTAAGNVLEMEVVTPAGDVLVVNEVQHPDLFWALRGGGGGTFGIVSKVTFRTHEMPEVLTGVLGTITASNASDYRRLVEELVAFFPDLVNAHWGEQIRLSNDNTLVVFMMAVDLAEEDVADVWRGLTDRLNRPSDSFAADIQIATGPFASLWDTAWWDANMPEMIRHDDRSGTPPGRFWWAANQEEVSQYWNAYQSRWLPVRLFEPSKRRALAAALFEASRHWPIVLHANKALSGAAPEALERDRRTSVNPAVFDAAALVISAAGQQYAFPGLPGREPDPDRAVVTGRKVSEAMRGVRAETPDSGTYLNECDYFEPDWQRAFWGDNYPRLLEIKQRIDPDNVFRVHHGVGSELPRVRRTASEKPSG